MDKKKWKKKIEMAAKDAGTYQPFFDAVIDTLAGILERRDEAEEKYKEAGSQILVEHVNKGGNTNIEQNPAIRLINDLNRDALSYWRELGLTSKAYKELKGMVIEEKPQMSALEKALKELAK